MAVYCTGLNNLKHFQSGSQKQTNQTSLSIPSLGGSFSGLRGHAEDSSLRAKNRWEHEWWYRTGAGERKRTPVSTGCTYIGGLDQCENKRKIMMEAALRECLQRESGGHQWSSPAPHTLLGCEIWQPPPFHCKLLEQSECLDNNIVPKNSRCILDSCLWTFLLSIYSHYFRLHQSCNLCSFSVEEFLLCNKSAQLSRASSYFPCLLWNTDSEISEPESPKLQSLRLQMKFFLSLQLLNLNWSIPVRSSQPLPKCLISGNLHFPISQTDIINCLSHT